MTDEGRKQREREKAAADAQQRQDLADGTTEICETAPADILLSLIDQVSEECGFSDFSGMAELWAEIVNDPKTARGVRTTALKALAHIASVTEAERVDTGDGLYERVDAIGYLRWLDHQGYLTGLLRAAFADGLFDLDDLDPPGADSVWEPSDL